MILGSRSKPIGRSLVLITHSPRQVRLAVNAVLARHMKLDRYQFMAIDIDGSRVTLIFLNKPDYQGVATHRLQNDGGNGSAVARATFMSVTIAGEHLPVGRYEPTEVREHRIVFDTKRPWGKP